MNLPIRLDRRARQLGAAVIGYLGAVAYGGAMLWMRSGWPDTPLQPADRILVFVLALLGAAAGWLVIDRLGRPGWKGLLHDIGLALASMTLAFTLGVAGLFPPAAFFAPLMVLLSLLHPLTGPIAVTGGVVLLVYARLTAPKPPGPATNPPA